MIPFMNVALIKSDLRDELRLFLDNHQVQTGIHWKPGNLFSNFTRLSMTQQSKANYDFLLANSFPTPLLWHD